MTFTSATHFKRGILEAKCIKFCEFTKVLQTLTFVSFFVINWQLKFHLDAVSYILGANNGIHSPRLSVCCESDFKCGPVVG